MCLGGGGGGGVGAVVVLVSEGEGGGGGGGGGGLTIGVGNATQRNDEEWILVLRERLWTADEARGWIRRTGAGEGRVSLRANEISIR